MLSTSCPHQTKCSIGHESKIRFTYSHALGKQKMSSSAGLPIQKETTYWNMDAQKIRRIAPSSPNSCSNEGFIRLKSLDGRLSSHALSPLDHLIFVAEK